jgi:hypothetical protein
MMAAAKVKDFQSGQLAIGKEFVRRKGLEAS